MIVIIRKSVVGKLNYNSPLSVSVSEKRSEFLCQPMKADSATRKFVQFHSHYNCLIGKTSARRLSLSDTIFMYPRSLARSALSNQNIAHTRRRCCAFHDFCQQLVTLIYFDVFLEGRDSGNSLQSHR